MSLGAVRKESDVSQTGTAWLARLPLLFLLGLTFLLGYFQLGNFDIWWHLRTGQLIPERGVPVTDWYGFASEDNVWIDVHWGFQILMAAAHRINGVPGMILLKALTGVVAVAICLFAYDRRWSVTVQTAVWLPALFLLSSRLYVRPETFTLLFTAIYLCVLFHAEKRPWLLWALPVVQVLWANFQGLFVFGPILLAMYHVEAFLRINQTRGLYRHLLPVTLAVALACCVSPYLLGNALFVLELWTRMRPEGALWRENIAELMDLSTFVRRGGGSNAYFWLIVGMLCLGAASIAAAWRDILLHRRAFRALPLIAFGWLSWQATRNGNHFALVAGTIACWNFGSVLGQRPLGRLQPWLNSLLVLAATYFVIHGDWYAMVGGHRRTGTAMRTSYYSHEAMKIAGRPGMPDRAAIFHMGHAAVYIYENGPHKKVLLDGRLEVHSAQAFRQYLTLQDLIGKGEQEWSPLLRSLDVGTLIIDAEHNHKLQAVALNHPEWICIHYDDVVGVFVRRGAASELEVEFDFRRWLFDGRLPVFQSPRPEPAERPRWLWFPPDDVFPDEADFLSERLYNVGLGLSAVAPHDPLRPITTLCALKNSQLAVARRPWAAETYRRLGSQLLALGTMVGFDAPLPAVDDAWRPHEGTLIAAGIHAMQQALQCDSSDYTAHFQLNQTFASLGMGDKSLEHLDTLVRLPAVNPTRIAIRDQLANEALERRKQLQESRKRIDPEDLSFEGLRVYAAAGLLDRGLERIELDAVDLLTAEQIDRIGTWLLLAGRVEHAERIYESTSKLPAVLVSLRLGACAQIAGDFDAARRRYLDAAEREPENFDAVCSLAILNLLAADQHQFRIYVERLQRLKPQGRQKRLTDWLANLLPRQS